MIITDEIKHRIRRVIEDHVSNESVTFYCGEYGVFELTCSRLVKEMKSKYPNIKSVLVTPYLDRTISDATLYDESLYPDLEKIPPRYAILKRNEYVIDHADLVIAYVEYDWGGAYKTLQYAKRKRKRIINLAENDI